MAYSKNSKKDKNNYLKNIKGAMNVVFDGKKTPPKRKKK
jgi:hypothetical protein